RHPSQSISRLLSFGVPIAPRPADGTWVRVRYAIGGMIAAALIALPAGAAAKQQGGQVEGLAAQQCAQEKADIGKKAFRKRYGVKRSMRACTRRVRPQVVAAAGTATQDCQAELTEN